MQTPTIKAVKKDGSRLYCGPTAIVVATGKKPSTVLRRINKLRNRKRTKRITGLSNHWLRKALESFGYELREEVWPSGLNFAEWLKERHKIINGQPFYQINNKNPLERFFIVNLTGHYVVVKGHDFIDNHTDGKVPVWKAPWQRKRVKRVFSVWKKSQHKAVIKIAA